MIWKHIKGIRNVPLPLQLKSFSSYSWKSPSPTFVRSYWSKQQWIWRGMQLPSNFYEIDNYSTAKEHDVCDSRELKSDRKWIRWKGWDYCIHLEDWDPADTVLERKIGPTGQGCIMSKIGHICDIMQLCTGHCNAVDVRQPGCKGGNQELKQRMWWCGFYIARASTESSRGLRIQYIQYEDRYLLSEIRCGRYFRGVYFFLLDWWFFSGQKS